MGPIRLIVCFVVAAALFGGGVYILYDVVFVASGLGTRARLLGIGIFLTLIGSIWLWIDFVKPAWKKLSGDSIAPGKPASPR